MGWRKMVKEELYNYKLMSPVVRLIKWPSVQYAVGDEEGHPDW
jgi:hypothetical protein